MKITTLVCWAMAILFAGLGVYLNMALWAVAAVLWTINASMEDI